MSGSMRFFDAHCDTVMSALSGELDFVAGHGRAHLDLPRLVHAGHCAQLFAVFAVRSYYPNLDLRGYAERAITTIRGWVAGSGGRLRLALTADDLVAVCSGGPMQDDSDQQAGERAVCALIGLEGADPLDGRADNLAHFYRLGVRNVIPAWDDNPFSGTSAGDGTALSPEGVRLVQLCEALGVMVDVSHLSDAAFRQVCDIATRPFIASHSNCRALCPSARNLSDGQIRALADRGGVMGINLAPDFVSPEYLVAWDTVLGQDGALLKGADAATRQKIRAAAAPTLAAIPRPEIRWLARQVQHAIEVGGEECIGLGGDLDGISFLPAGMTGVESYPLIADVLRSAGLTTAQIEKVCWRNMARVFKDVLASGDSSVA